MIRFTENFSQLGAFYNTHAVITVPELMEESAEDLADLITAKTRNYIPAAHRLAPGQRTTQTATGRLWSSWGTASRRTDDSEFNPGDAVRRISKQTGRSTRIKIQVGTEVPYAQLVNDGRGPGNRYAYHFIEKGRMDAEAVAGPAMEDKWRDKLTGTAALSSFRASAQARNVKGRFV